MPCLLQKLEKRNDPHPNPPPERGRESNTLSLEGEGWGEERNGKFQNVNPTRRQKKGTAVSKNL
jgi:hypothetical protein